jgi:hypothetical protein
MSSLGSYWILKTSVFRDITLCSPLRVNRRFGGTCYSACHLLSRWFVARLIFRPWRWRRYIPPKHWLTQWTTRHYIPDDGTLHNHRCSQHTMGTGDFVEDIGLVVCSFWLQIQRSWVRFPALPDFLRGSRSGRGSTQPREDNWGATWKKK